MNSTDLELTQCLEQELQLTRQLLEALRQEESALLARDVEPMQSTTLRKSELVTRFFELRQRRLACLARQGLPADDGSMARWLEQRGEAQARALWERLLDELALARDLNRTNGLLIHQLASRNQSALQALRTRNSVILYGPKGQGSARSTFNTVVG